MVLLLSFHVATQAYYQVKSHLESWHCNTSSALDRLDSDSYKLLLSCKNARAMRSRHDSRQNVFHSIVKSVAIAARLDF